MSSFKGENNVFHLHDELEELFGRSTATGENAISGLPQGDDNNDEDDDIHSPQNGNDSDVDARAVGSDADAGDSDDDAETTIAPTARAAAQLRVSSRRVSASSASALRAPASSALAPRAPASSSSASSASTSSTSSASTSSVPSPSAGPPSASAPPGGATPSHSRSSSPSLSSQTPTTPSLGRPSKRQRSNSQFEQLNSMLQRQTDIVQLIGLGRLASQSQDPRLDDGRVTIRKAMAMLLDIPINEMEGGGGMVAKMAVALESVPVADMFTVFMEANKVEEALEYLRLKIQ